MRAGRIGSAELAELVARRAQRQLHLGIGMLERMSGLLAGAADGQTASLAAAARVDEGQAGETHAGMTKAGMTKAGETHAGKTKADPAPGLTAELTADLQFLSGPEGHPQIRLRIRGSLPLVCQRCLDAVTWPVAVEALLTVVGSEVEAQGLADPFDTAIMPAEGLDPGELVVDEVLASLPLAPMHEPGTGRGPCAAVAATGSTAAPAVETQRPFADLRARLKGRGGE